MKVTIKRNEAYIETLVDIRCTEDPDTETKELLKKIQSIETQLKVTKEGHLYKLAADDIFYIECVDDRTFVYTADDTYKSALKLYQVEEQLQNTDFIRISKSVLLNVTKLDSVRSLLNAKIEVHMLNGERLLVNRHYVTAFKKKFGV